MRPSLLRLGSELRIAQRLASQQRMMGYESSGELTVRERTAVYKLDMDNLPVPSGAWQTEYSKVQTKNHIHMVISTVLFIGMSYYFMTRNYVIKPDLKKPLNLEEYYQAKLAEKQEG